MKFLKKISLIKKLHDYITLYIIKKYYISTINYNNLKNKPKQNLISKKNDKRPLHSNHNPLIFIQHSKML